MLRLTAVIITVADVIYDNSALWTMLGNMQTVWQQLKIIFSSDPFTNMD